HREHTFLTSDLGPLLAFADRYDILRLMEVIRWYLEASIPLPDLEHLMLTDRYGFGTLKTKVWDAASQPMCLATLQHEKQSEVLLQMSKETIAKLIKAKVEKDTLIDQYIRKLITSANYAGYSRGRASAGATVTNLTVHVPDVRVSLISRTGRSILSNVVFPRQKCLELKMTFGHVLDIFRLFAGGFEDRQLEGHDRKIIPLPESPFVVSLFLEWLYDGIFLSEPSVTRQLLQFADKYDIPSLVKGIKLWESRIGDRMKIMVECG
ncbi:hypothetical protein HDU93_003442, partial [Gonapodya sp. JEL0774]